MGELRSLLRKAAGARSLELRGRTTLWPRLLPLEGSSPPQYNGLFEFNGHLHRRNAEARNTRKPFRALRYSALPRSTPPQTPRNRIQKTAVRKGGEKSLLGAAKTNEVVGVRRELEEAIGGADE